MKITDALVVEHAVLRAVFEGIERLWPQIKTLEEPRLLASLVEGLLRQHAAKEENLLFVAYDHVLQDRGQLQRMSQEHDEIDERLLLIRQAATVAEAKRLFRVALSAAKSHFLFEELNIFPAIEQTLQEQTLEKLVHGTGYHLDNPRGGCRRHRTAQGQRRRRGTGQARRARSQGVSAC